ncbi:hypothetical protein [Simplicispira suum]|uniref:PsiF repeat-containing protein n=1 Tax=Simplicispira suum TaxID=2109915 RepID=A0A2S0N251_9BURK|nr:hypothetical protein [Simplicispira suum]AVO42117.1 hypothetical protein C6571_13250 [Simplicispira suum]
MPHLLSLKPRRTFGPLRAATAFLALVCAAEFMAPSSALAKSQKNTHSAASSAGQKKGATKTTYHPSPSEETRAERERRLFRECKGMHNAGACKGFTRR